MSGEIKGEKRSPSFVDSEKALSSSSCFLKVAVNARKLPSFILINRLWLCPSNSKRTCISMISLFPKSRVPFTENQSLSFLMPIWNLEISACFFILNLSPSGHSMIAMSPIVWISDNTSKQVSGVSKIHSYSDSKLIDCRVGHNRNNSLNLNSSSSKFLVVLSFFPSMSAIRFLPPLPGL